MPRSKPRYGKYCDCHRTSRRLTMAGRSPLHEVEEALGARFETHFSREIVEDYGDPAKEYLAVRNECGALDLCHLGKLRATGRKRDWAAAGRTAKPMRAATTAAFLPISSLPILLDAVYAFCVTASCSLSAAGTGRKRAKQRVALPAGGGLCYNHGALWKRGGFPEVTEARRRSRRRVREKSHLSIARRARRRSNRTSAS